MGARLRPGAHFSEVRGPRAGPAATIRQRRSSVGDPAAAILQRRFSRHEGRLREVLFHDGRGHDARVMGMLEGELVDPARPAPQSE